MSVDGRWNLVLQTPMGDQNSTLEVLSNGEALTGNLVSPMGSAAIYSGSVKGNDLTWKVDITSPMNMTLDFSATVDGNALVGKAKAGMFGSMTFTGTRA